MSKIQISDLDLPVRRLRTAFYAAGHLLPIDFADRLALLERRERILDLAEALLDLADAMDAPLMDREPEPVEAEDDEATQQPVTLAPDWLRTKNGRRAEKVRHRDAPQSSGQLGHLKVSHSGTPWHRRQVGDEEVVHGAHPLHAFRAPNDPPGFDSNGTPIEPKRSQCAPQPDFGATCAKTAFATGLRNACLAGTGFWVLVGLAGWGLA
jgi:hypothetical protein